MNNDNTPRPVGELIREEFKLAPQDKIVQGLAESLPVKKKKQKKEKTDATNKVIYALDVAGVIDVVDVGEKLQYLTVDLELVDTTMLDDNTYAPPPKKACPYYFAQADEVLKHIKEHAVNNCTTDDLLYQDLFTYHAEISDLPQEDFYHLLVLWDFHTYLLEKLHFSPLLYLYAVKERGKSRTAKGALYVARRGIFTECVREADIIRLGNDHRAALGFDVKNFPKKIERANCDDLILARFEKGAVSSRTLWPEKGAFKDTKVFQLFGATIIATNRPVDDILESRSISIDMKPSSKLFSNPVLPETALELKNRLTAFRVAHYATELVVADKPAHGRLGDIISPLYRIMLTFFPEMKDIFMQMLRKIEMQKKEDATDSLEARILEKIIVLEDQVVGAFLPIELVANEFNKGKDVKFNLQNETVGKILRSLGFSKRRTAGQRGIYYDSDLVKKLVVQYGIETSYVSNDSETDIQDLTVDGTQSTGDIHEMPSYPSQASQPELGSEHNPTPIEQNYVKQVEKQDL